MYCPNCGKKLKNGVCKKCGYQYTAPSTMVSAQYYVPDAQNPGVVYALQENGAAQPSPMYGEVFTPYAQTATKTKKRGNFAYLLAGIFCWVFLFFSGWRPRDLEYYVYVIIATMLLLKSFTRTKLWNFILADALAFFALSELLYLIPNITRLMRWFSDLDGALYLVSLITFALEFSLLALMVIFPRRLYKLSALSFILATVQLVVSILPGFLYGYGYAIGRTFAYVGLWFMTWFIGRGVHKEGQR